MGVGNTYKGYQKITFLIGLTGFSERLDISVLLPMHNEAKRIENCVRKVEKTVKSFSSSYEIIIAEDGSIDNTNTIAERLAKANPRLKHLHSPRRLGKGGAIKSALRIAKGDVIAFLDADLATNLEHLQQAVVAAKQCGGMAIGSRHVRGSRVMRPMPRTIFSLVYNLLVKMLFFDGVHDHQCGFKALSHELAEVLMDKVESNGLFIDTEIIVRAKRSGFTVSEISVEWAELRGKGESKVNLFHDAWNMGMELLKLRCNIGREKAVKSGQK